MGSVARTGLEWTRRRYVEYKKYIYAVIHEQIAIADRGRGAVFNALTQRQRRRLDQSVHPHPAKSRLGCGTILIDGLCERPTLLLHWRSGGFCRLPLVGMGLVLACCVD